METKTDIEIKAMIYDALVQIENSQNFIKAANDELQKRAATNTVPANNSNTQK